MPARASRLRGCGQASHNRTPPATTPRPKPAEPDAAVAAPGMSATRSTAALVAPKSAAHNLRSQLPAPGATGAIARAVMPPRSETSMGHVKSMLASGATIGTTPNADAAIGAVPTTATVVAESGAAKKRAFFGRTAAVQPRANLPKRARPPTATTESWKPSENAAVGSASSIRTEVADSAASGSARRPSDTAAVITTAITQQRTADVWTPVKNTYTKVNAATVNTRGTGLSPIAVHIHAAIAASTMR